MEEQNPFDLLLSGVTCFKKPDHENSHQECPAVALIIRHSWLINYRWWSKFHYLYMHLNPFIY